MPLGAMAGLYQGYASAPGNNVTATWTDETGAQCNRLLGNPSQAVMRGRKAFELQWRAALGPRKWTFSSQDVNEMVGAPAACAAATCRRLRQKGWRRCARLSFPLGPWRMTIWKRSIFHFYIKNKDITVVPVDLNWHLGNEMLWLPSVFVGAEPTSGWLSSGNLRRWKPWRWPPDASALLALEVWAQAAAKRRDPRGRRIFLFDTCDAAVERVAAPAHGPSSLEALAKECGVVLLCLPNGAVVKRTAEVLAPKLQPGEQLAVMQMLGMAPELPASIVHAFQLQLSEELCVVFLDAPVTGAPARAVAGTLTVMAVASRAAG
eukprot:Skav233256  [mRNA]  locus=scaffold2371:57845:61177:- [translate_table: standard]